MHSIPIKIDSHFVSENLRQTIIVYFTPNTNLYPTGNTFLIHFPLSFGATCDASLSLQLHTEANSMRDPSGMKIMQFLK